MAMKQRMPGGPRQTITSLQVMVKAVEGGLWPTPTSRDYKDGEYNPNVTDDRGPGRPLGRAVWPTPHGMPKQGQARNPGPSGNELGRAVNRSLWRTPNSAVIEPKSSVTKLSGRTPADPQVGLADQVGGSLNPHWVELLMGFPAGWTDVH